MTTTVHGQRHAYGHNKPSGAYVSYRAMVNRCTNANQRDFKNYGGRGVTIDPRWSTFEAFFLDMGDRPSGHDLGRLDHAKPYGPDNCEWQPREENRRWLTTTSTPRRRRTTKQRKHPK